MYKKLTFPIFEDLRGSLLACDKEHLPFTPRRVFFIYNVPEGKSRGQHAVSCDLIIVVLKGGVKININSDPNNSIDLRAGADALLIERNTYLELSEFSNDAILAVLASASYHGTDYFSQDQD